MEKALVPLTVTACDVTAVCPYLPIPKEAFFFCRVANFDQHEYWLMVAHKVATVNNAQGIVDSSGAKVPKGDAVIMGYFLEHPSGSTHRRRYRIEEMEVTMDVRLMFHLDIGEELKELSNGVFEVPKTTDTMLQGLLGLV